MSFRIKSWNGGASPARFDQLRKILSPKEGSLFVLPPSMTSGFIPRKRRMIRQSSLRSRIQIRGVRGLSQFFGHFNGQLRVPFSAYVTASREFIRPVQSYKSFLLLLRAASAESVTAVLNSRHSFSCRVGTDRRKFSKLFANVTRKRFPDHFVLKPFPLNPTNTPATRLPGHASSILYTISSDDGRLTTLPSFNLTSHTALLAHIVTRTKSIIG